MRTDKFVNVCYAHRGLHNPEKGIPENSLKAFELAKECGYGVELDVQLTLDGYVVVFHDDDLNRVCGINRRVDEVMLDELKKLTLFETEEHIPLFSEALKTLVGLKKPVIVEIKNGKRNSELCKKTLELLKGFDGDYCIESFNPLIVKWFKDNAPGIVRGQLATEVNDYVPCQSRLAAWLLSNCFLSFMNKPDFIAYKNIALPRSVRRLLKKGTLLFLWTVKEVRRVNADGIIFEGFEPDENYF